MELSRIAVPSFDLAWLECEEDVYVLIPGGGGSTKSGVKNQIQIAKVSKGGTAFEFIESFKTDTDDKTSLCSGIYCGTFQVLLLRTYCVKAIKDISFAIPITLHSPETSRRLRFAGLLLQSVERRAQCCRWHHNVRQNVSSVCKSMCMFIAKKPFIPLMSFVLS
jgi:hypothetical protein